MKRASANPQNADMRPASIIFTAAMLLLCAAGAAPMAYAVSSDCC